MKFKQRLEFCCGISELGGVTNISKADIERLVEGGQGFDDEHAAVIRLEPGRMYCFTDAYGPPRPGSGYTNRHGRKLAEYIKERKAGILTEVGPWLNKTSGNQMMCWMWLYEPPKPIKEKEKPEIKIEKPKTARRRIEARLG